MSDKKSCSPMSPKPIIFGASGFVGKNFIHTVGLENCIPVSRINKGGNHWIQVDLLNEKSIESALKLSNTVINLAYAQEASPKTNIKMAINLARACLKFNVSKLIHCSTAIVAGGNSENLITEAETCYPKTEYEKTKHEIEKIFLEVENEGLKVNILRPTGVVGPGGKNLKKMLTGILYDKAWINYIRSSVNGERPLNLVSVKDIVRALMHFCEHTSLPSGIYICSADDDPDNKFNAVENIMRRILMKPLLIDPIRFPKFILEGFLKIKRSGSGCFPNRRYSSEKIMKTGFKCSVSISQAVTEYILSEMGYGKEI